MHIGHGIIWMTSPIRHNLGENNDALLNEPSEVERFAITVRFFVPPVAPFTNMD